MLHWQRYSIPGKPLSQKPANLQVSISKQRVAVTNIINFLSETEISDDPRPLSADLKERLKNESSESRGSRAFFHKINPVKMPDAEIEVLTRD